MKSTEYLDALVNHINRFTELISTLMMCINLFYRSDGETLTFASLRLGG